jgi:hypothetical protein
MIEKEFILNPREINNTYTGPERRQFIRLAYKTPLMYKVCKEETISKLLEGYTRDISQSGLLCNIKDEVPKDCILWLGLDMGMLSICEEIEKNVVIVQKGILGKVVRMIKQGDTGYDVGVRFITRREKPPIDLNRLI